ncbi:thiamine biosynthesis protein ApbE [Taibaiella sp. KBW10]|uniref:FAD:protein FMN transferase n=1 Tax=Taibaiella sp. KBW10 TaxID=2153357 RepID=UPI000F591FA4|nr:FAD:protein FMN transferase [Taibaiella sp. KBW10]RQO30216.1 thiamine biosynthesis protein ApbE [Taibaiella sp. KBW10]
MNIYTRSQKLMGSAFTLGVVCGTEADAHTFLDMGIAEIERLEQLLSEFLPGSETAKINTSILSGPLSIDKECFDLIARCQDLSKLTQGDFDITIGPLKKLFRFKNEAFEMPDKALIQQTLFRVGYHKLLLDAGQNSIGFSVRDMKISFAAIGKGYASDRVKTLWLKAGLDSGYINASGDLCAFGSKPDGSQWNIGIADPDDTRKILLYVPLNNAAAATSGDYEQHFIWKGKRYGHNIDPHTGMPLSGIKSVSIFSPSAELSDALATAVYVKGIKKGLDFINQLPQTHGIIIDENNDIYGSKYIQYEMVNQ